MPHVHVVVKLCLPPCLPLDFPAPLSFPHQVEYQLQTSSPRLPRSPFVPPSGGIPIANVFFTPVPFIDLLMVFFTPNKRRVGDYVAMTMVVPEGPDRERRLGREVGTRCHFPLLFTHVVVPLCVHAHGRLCHSTKGCCLLSVCHGGRHRSATVGGNPMSGHARAHSASQLLYVQLRERLKKKQDAALAEEIEVLNHDADSNDHSSASAQHSQSVSALPPIELDAEALQRMGTQEMVQVLVEHGIDFSDCTSEQSLRDRLEEASQQTPRR